MIKRFFNGKWVGVCVILLSFLLNPYFIQRFFVPDGNLQSTIKISCIFLFEIVLCIVGIVLILKSKGVTPKGIFLRLFLPVAAAMAIWIVLEYCSYVVTILFLPKNSLDRRFNPNYGLKVEHLYTVENDQNLGYVLKKNDSGRATKTYADGKIIYDASYMTDDFRRRIVGVSNSNAKKHLLLFGCSFAFGEGLPDTETFQYFLQKSLPEYAIYNYGVPGYGPQQMLALLEAGRLQKEVEQTDGIGLYEFVDPNNMRRLVGAASTNWVYSFPYYALDNHQQITRKGNFFSNRSIRTYLYSLYNALKRYSFFLRLINLDLPVSMSNQDILLTYKLIEKAKLLYEQQFHGKFYVLIHPFTNYSKEVMALIQLLKMNNISVLEYTVKDSAKQYSIIGDGHPNGALNMELSSYVVSLLETQNDGNENNMSVH